MENLKGKPLVSVIVPIYNAEQYLTACVDALLAQTYTHIEILLVDDGSKDRSVMNMLNEIVVYECYIFRMAECREQGIMPLK